MQTVLIKLFFTIFFINLGSLTALATGISLPKDSSGWTIFTPSADSRIMYVSESGNDTLAASSGVYTLDGISATSVHPDWENPFNPTGIIQTFATSGAAYAQVREGYPDWVLFKRGNEFTLTQSANGCIYPKGGRSATEPSLISAYGASGLSPVLKAGNRTVFWDINGLRWFAISGLDFYANERDPASPDYIDNTLTGEGSGSALYLAGSAPDKVQGILVEGCKFRYFKSGGHYSCGSDGGVNCNGIEHYRCVYYDQYSGIYFVGETPYTGHSAGLGGTGAQIDVVECIFDHNGWLNQVGTTGDESEATIYNHNVYASNLHNSSFEKNISMRSSSIGFKITGSNGAASINNLVFDDNLIYDNEIGVQLEDNYHTDGGGIDYRAKDVVVKNNVLLNLGQSRPTARHLAWGIQAVSWDGGSIFNNLIAHNYNSGWDDVTGGLGMVFYDASRNVNVSGNVMYGLKNYDQLVINNAYGGDLSTGMQLSNNKIQTDTLSLYTIKTLYDISSGWTISDNEYASSKSDGTRFTFNSVNKADSEWATLTGDNSTLTTTSFPAPTRDIATYMVSIGEQASEAAFISMARAQDRYNWDDRITATEVNSWVRAGFGLAYDSGPNPPQTGAKQYRGYRFINAVD